MRLIDADELKEQLKQRYEKAVEWRDETSSFYCERATGKIVAYLEAIRTLNNAPTVDAVPVVRCKDCRWADCRWADDDPQAGRFDCNHPDGRNAFYCLPDEFCDKGERRQENETHLSKILEAPTVDAVPVVRCKDCISFVKGKDQLEEIGCCNFYSIYGCDENGFCSFGRKKR